jgi:hypothetical protein
LIRKTIGIVRRPAAADQQLKGRDMARAKMIVLARATEGQTKELDEWYETRHVHDLLAVPGITSIERFDVQMMKAPDGESWDYAGIYEIEAEDVSAVLKEMGARMGTPKMPGSPTLDSSKTLAIIAHEKPRK